MRNNFSEAVRQNKLWWNCELIRLNAVHSFSQAYVDIAWQLLILADAFELIIELGVIF